VLDFEAVIWGPKPGQKRQLPPLPGDTVGEGIWINDLGQAVGVSGSCADTAIPPFVAGPHAVLWDVNGTPHDLGNLGGTANHALLGIGNAALSMNNKTQMTGASALPGSTNNHAFLWTKETGKMRDPGTLEGDVNSAGLAINNRGEVVGDSVDGDLATGNPCPFLWQNGTMSDLNALVPADTTMYLLGSFGINDQGYIVGFGLDLNTFEVHAFLATPSTVGESAAHTRELPAHMVLPQDVRDTILRDIRHSRR
jgi:probable HAF family extracellular repeat protein